MAPRQQWVDISRGLGIILVVYGHVLLGHFGSDQPAWVTAQAAFIYAFHMPLFFMLSGLFLWSSLGRDGFLRSRWSQLIYPYFLWSLVTVTLEIVLARYVNSPLTTRDALLIPFVPFEQFWFLYALMVCQLVALLAYPRKSLLMLAAFLGTILLAVVGGGWIVIRSFEYLPFVVLGIIGKGAFEELARAPRLRQLIVAGVAWAVFVLLWVSGMRWPIFVLGALGGVGTVAFAMLVARSSALGALGRASLAIYLLHTIFSAGTRIGLNLFGFAPPSLTSVALSVIAGIALPYAVWVWARRNGRTKLLGFGS